MRKVEGSLIFKINKSDNPAHISRENFSCVAVLSVNGSVAGGPRRRHRWWGGHLCSSPKERVGWIVHCMRRVPYLQ